MAHTPGPWEFTWGGAQGHIALVRLNGSTVYQVSDVTAPDFPSGPPRYCLDDLRLMAAVPELLEACKQLRDCLSDWMEIADSDDLRDSDSEAIAIAVAAIAKAEGKGE